MEDTNIKDELNYEKQELDIITDTYEKEEIDLSDDNIETNYDINKKVNKRRNKELKSKITCKVNYNLPKKNKTSILYSNGGTNYSVFIDGIYEGTLEIEYVGKEFLVKNIKKINIL